MTARHLPMARKGWTDGSAHDVDRVAGNADRPRPRRASARRLATLADPIPGRSLALNGRPPAAHNRIPPAIEGLLPLLSIVEVLNEATPTSSFRRRFVMSGPGCGCRPALLRGRTSFGVHPAPSLVGGGGRGTGAGSARTNAKLPHLLPRQLKNNRRTIEERCSSQAAGQSVPRRTGRSVVRRGSGGRRQWLAGSRRSVVHERPSGIR
jgi:hypothetical protein